MRKRTRIVLATSMASFWIVAAVAAHADRLVLKTVKPGPIQTVPMQPFTVELVAERGETVQQLSAVAFTLDVPDGILLVGEELLVDPLLGLGNSREGLNLVFECTPKSPLPVLRFRLVATKPVAGGVIGLEPDRKTGFLGLISCREQDFSKYDCAPDSVLVDAR